MTTRPCAAKDPLKCRYHGTQSGAMLVVLRDKMAVARSVYSATTGASEQWEAYMNVRKAEVDYYATDEGQASLIKVIQDSEPGDYRNSLMEILSAADQTRMKNEMDDSDSTTAWNMFMRPAPIERRALPTSPLLSAGLNERGEMVHLLSAGYVGQNKFDFKWNASNGYVTYGEVAPDGSQDMDSARSLGQFGSYEEAHKAAEDWYNKSIIGYAR